MFTITPALFKIAAPTCKTPQVFIDLLNEHLPKFGIDTRLEVVHFLAQYSYETGGFNNFIENTNYTSPERLVEIFGKYFYLNTKTPRKYDAREYVGHPDKIANIVYANRNGNGGPETGHGYKYRGRAACHLTFLDNYNAFQKDMGHLFPCSIVEKPEQLEQPFGIVMAGVWYWNYRKINIAAIKNSVEAVTRLVNGGTNGLDGRRSLTQKLLDATKP